MSVPLADLERLLANAAGGGVDASAALRALVEAHRREPSAAAAALPAAPQQLPRRRKLIGPSHETDSDQSDQEDKLSSFGLQRRRRGQAFGNIPAPDRSAAAAARVQAIDRKRKRESVTSSSDDDASDDGSVHQPRSKQNRRPPASSAAAAAVAGGNRANDEGPYIMSAAQEVVVVKCVQSCLERGRFVNESDGGQGKTVQTVEAAHRLNLPILVVGLAGAMPTKWAEHAWRQKVRLVEYLSWDGLRGARLPGMDQSPLSQHANNYFPVRLSHSWLTREDAWTGDWKKKKVLDPETGEMVEIQIKVYDTRFTATAQLEEAVERGIIVVADEIQKSKNDSLQSRALACIAGVVFRDAPTLLSPGRNGSCMIALSATTLNKPVHALRICRSIGLLPPDVNRAFVYDRSSATYQVNNGGVRRLMKLCKELDARAYRIAERETLNNASGSVLVDQRTGRILADGVARNESFVRRERLKRNDCTDWFLMTLYVSILRTQVSGAVSERFDADPDVQLDFRNVVYLMQADKQERFNELTRELERLRQARASEMVMEPVRRELETMKNDLFIAAPRKVLDTDPHAKVVILMNFIEGIRSVGEALKEYGVVYYYGAVSSKQRVRNLEAFQRANDDVRVFVGQIVAASEGIDLHDITGLWPRTTFLSPSSLAVPLQQAIKRTKRQRVKGKVTVVMVYGGDGELLHRDGDDPSGEDRRLVDEATVMQNLISASGRMKSVAEQQVIDGVVFLDQLPTWRETTPGVFELDTSIDLSQGNMRDDDGEDEDGEIDERGVGRAYAASAAAAMQHAVTADGGKSRGPRAEAVAAALARHATGDAVKRIREGQQQQQARPARLFRVGSRVFVLGLAPAAAGPDAWMPAVVIGVDEGTYRVATESNASVGSILPANIRSPTEAELTAQPESWQHIRVPLAAMPAPTAASLAAAPARATVVGAQTPNGLSCLSSDWPLDASAASIQATRDTHGPLPEIREFGFTVLGQWYPTVTHFVHSVNAMAKSQQVREAATCDQARKLWPFPTAQGGISSPAVRRLFYQAMLAKFVQCDYALRVLLGTGDRILTAADARIDDISTLMLIRDRLRKNPPASQKRA